MKDKLFCTGPAGTEIFYEEQTDSTNEWAKRAGDAGAAHGSVYWAGSQSAGKGRRGRSWVSDDTGNLYFTILLRPKLKPEKASMLTLVMAYAAANAIEQETQRSALIKWPNDIVVNRKKVCGILSEMKLAGTQMEYCIIGVGINVGQKQFDTELQEKATSLAIESGRAVDRQALLTKTLANFRQAYEQFVESQDLTFLQEEYNQLLINKDALVRVLDPRKEWEGIARGITSTGELVVESEDGSLEEIYAGEVSVRGLYGYV